MARGGEPERFPTAGGFGIGFSRPKRSAFEHEPLRRRMASGIVGHLLAYVQRTDINVVPLLNDEGPRLMGQER